jgi:hypothetical protein
MCKWHIKNTTRIESNTIRTNKGIMIIPKHSRHDLIASSFPANSRKATKSSDSPLSQVLSYQPRVMIFALCFSNVSSSS